jgi:hypothetical protein
METVEAMTNDARMAESALATRFGFLRVSPIRSSLRRTPATAGIRIIAMKNARAEPYVALLALGFALSLSNASRNLSIPLFFLGSGLDRT